MLKTLNIKNLALIKSQEIEFSEGLNIILGETGAGKSLIFDALFFVLSLQTDKSLLRTGEQMMRVDAEFYPISADVHAILQQLELDDDSLVLSRILYADGRTSSKLNGSPISQNVVKKLAECLVDSFMQHENMEILKSANHLGYIDRFCDLKTEKAALSELLGKVKEVEKNISLLGGSDEERLKRQDYLEYQIGEIESADIELGEDEKIDERLKVLNNSEKIVECLGEGVSELDRAISGILNAERSANKLSDLGEISAYVERIESARLELDDVAESLKDILADADADPIELERLEERKDKLRSLKRRYGGSLEGVLQTLESYKRELDELADSKDRLEKLTLEREQLIVKANEIASQIHAKRVESAKKVKAGLEKEVADLGMKKARFEVEFGQKPLSQEGYDEVKFVFSANVGQDLKELSKTASGGESSRIMLAMKNMFARPDAQKTLLFDEIDSGVSGEIGNMMAQKLKNISLRDQVIAITHLPQVASVGRAFFKVEKSLAEGQTISTARRIEGNEVTKEIAHIIGGNNLTDIMLKNAKELYERGQN